MGKAKRIQLYTIAILLGSYFLPNLSIAGDTTLVDFKSFQYNIISMVSDSSGNIWFNSGTGLYKFDGKKIKQVSTESWRGTLIFWKGVLVMRETLEKQNIITPNPRDTKHKEWAKFLPSPSSIIMLASDKYHRIWVTTGKNLYGFEIDTTFEILLPGQSIRGILKDDNNLYVNTYNGIFKNQNKILDTLRFSHGNSLPINTKDILIIANQPVIFNKRTKNISFILFSKEPKTQAAVNQLKWKQEGLDYIYACKSKTDVLVGTSRGLFYLRNDSLYYAGLRGVIEYIEAVDDDVFLATSVGIFKKTGDTFVQDNRFPTMYFNSIKKIDDTWWATSERGVWIVTSKHKQAQRLFKHKTLGNIETYCVEKDNRGFIWVSTTSGIYRLRPYSRYYETYLLSEEFNKRSSYYAEDLLYFGTISRLVRFDPRKFPSSIQKKFEIDPSKWAYIATFIVILSLSINILLWRRWQKVRQELTKHQIEEVNQKDRFFKQLEQHIQENIATVTVESLSHAVGMNSRKLYRFMESNYDIKPGDMIRNMKQVYIRETLKQYPETDLSNLAQSVGYSTPHLKRLLEQESAN